MFQALAIIAGIICLIWGISASLTWLIVLGVILLALGGVWVFFWGGNFDFFDW